MICEISESSTRPARTGQVRRGRSIKLTALSFIEELSGHASGEQNVSKGSFVHIVPLNPAYPTFAGRGKVRPDECEEVCGESPKNQPTS